MDIFASHKTTHCQLWFSLREGDATCYTGRRRSSPLVAQSLSLRFSSESYNSSTAAEDEERQTQGDSESPPMARPAVVSRADESSHWIVEAIAAPFESPGTALPSGLRVPSTRSVAASWAAWRGVALEDICRATSWAPGDTFTCLV